MAASNAEMAAKVKLADQARQNISKQTIEELVATFDPEFQKRLKDRVLLAGGGSQIRGLHLAIEREMHKQLGGGKVSRIQEPVYGGSNGALKIAHDMPADYWEKLK